MDFLDISSVEYAYHYVVKIEQKFKQKNRWDFASVNASQQKAGKDNLNMQTKGPSKDNQPPENSSKLKTKKGNGKMKKDTSKCDFNKSPTTTLMNTAQSSH